MDTFLDHLNIFFFCRAFHVVPPINVFALEIVKTKDRILVQYEGESARL